MLAAETNNKMPKNNGLIKSALRSNQSESKIGDCINEIKTNFPKFRENKGFYFFREWGNRCNWIVRKELRGNSEGTPKEAIEKNRIDKKRLDIIRLKYIRLKGWNEKDLMPDDYARIHKAIKALLIKAKTTERVLQALNWVAKQNYDNWTMETVVKKFPDAIKPICPKCKGKGRFTNIRGYSQICDCAKGKSLEVEQPYNPRL